ncbi:MAG: hypothetical protein KY457_03270 [Actinobacteria bacterium]|nr:hypothetical protein [Actinomycetota bacterium]
MRPLVAAALGAALALSTALPALAHPTVELAPTLPTDLTHARTDNVEYLGRFPEHTGTAGGRVVGDVFFVTDPRGVYAYDVSSPEKPLLLDSVTLYQNGLGAALAQEDPDTDGSILLVDGSPSPGTSNTLQVVDVSNPRDLRIIGSAPVSDHTWTCVSTGPGGNALGHTKDRSGKPGKGVPDHAQGDGCAFAYGRSGHIVDLRNPTAPVLLSDKSWRTSTGYNTPYTHDLTEIRPGLVMSAGNQNVLMDTSDPTAPVLLNTIGDPNRFGGFLGYHSVEWAQDGKAPIAVFGTEIGPRTAGVPVTQYVGSDCEGDNSVIETWDVRALVEAIEAYEDGEMSAREVQQVESQRLDAFDAGGRGIFVQGQAPGHVLYCAHWMEPHADFDDGGLLAISYYDRGTRFVQVGADGVMTEIGWITPAEGYSGSVQWIGTASDGSGEVAYIMDYRRGVEVVKLDPGIDATGVVVQQADVVAAGATVTPLGAGDGGVPTSSAVAAAFGVTLAGVELFRRRRAQANA